VLLDEVEALAVNRSRASLETNPVDVHRATDAVLSGVDRVAGAWPNVTFVATTNYEPGVDGAFLSRADLIEHVGTPGPSAVRAILVDTMRELTGANDLDGPALDDLAMVCVAAGMDARQVRKLVLRAVVSRKELALAPDRLRIEDVAAVVADEAGARPARS
jgi:AAA+ superfamily predicted ATPase